jgi:hypothetical protein
LTRPDGTWRFELEFPEPLAECLLAGIARLHWPPPATLTTDEAVVFTRDSRAGVGSSEHRGGD